jgi:acetyl esterase/lipase
VRTAWSFIRLLVAVVLCAVASLVIFPAPLPLFRLQLLVTEYGHWLFIVPLFLAILTTRRTPLALLGTVVALIAAFLFLTPVIRAAALAHRLQAELGNTLPASGPASESPDTETPFSWRNLWMPSEAPQVECERYTYASHGDQNLQISYYRNGDSAAAPCVIVIDESGWEDGSPKDFSALNEHLARRGYAVAAIEYRRAPHWPWPAQRQDVLEAMDYLAEHEAHLRLDPQRFVLLGRSTGGQIAEAVAYGVHRAAIRGCIAFYAPADMSYAYEIGRAHCVGNCAHLRQYLGGTPSEARSNYDDASGVLLANRNSPPTLLLHGQFDELAWFQQSERLSARLDALGAPHNFVSLPWATHDFDSNFHGPGGQVSTYAVDAFLNAVMR